jgi:hypothetical protein
MIVQTKKNPNRNGTADLLKGLAVLFMIQVHIMEQFASPDTANSIIGKIAMFLGGPPCAPVFMAVMGYFLAFSSRPLTYFLKRGALLFLGGILLNTFRSANLIIRIMSGEVHLDPWFYIMGADILTLAGLSLIVTGFLRLVLKNRAVLFFLLAGIVAAISPYLDNFGSKGVISSHILGFFGGTEEWSYFPFFPWYAYVLTGYAFRLVVQGKTLAGKIDIQNQFLYFIPSWILVIITLPYASAITCNLSGPGGYYHHGILFFGWVLLFMLSYLVAIKLVEINYGDHVIVRSIKWMGEKVTILYVIQWLIIGNIATVLFRSQDLFQVWAWFIVITAATILAGFLYVKIRKIMKSVPFPGKAE